MNPQMQITQKSKPSQPTLGFQVTLEKPTKTPQAILEERNGIGVAKVFVQLHLFGGSKKPGDIFQRRLTLNPKSKKDVPTSDPQMGVSIVMGVPP